MLQRSDESLIQPVRSHAVCPADADAVGIETPRLDPWMLTTADPVPGMFVRPSPLAAAISKDRLEDTVPVRIPAVSTERIVRLSPLLILPRVEVSDSHVERSQDDGMPDKCNVYETSPRLFPIHVKLVEPVPIIFSRNTLLNLGRSVVRPSVALTVESVTDSATSRVAREDPSVFERSAVSEIQIVFSVPVVPNRTCAVADEWPKPDPVTVKLTDPVALKLTRKYSFPSGLSLENSIVLLFDFEPAVSTRRPDFEGIEDAVLPTVHVSDAHEVISHDVARLLICCVRLYSPKLPPNNVMLCEPEPALFVRRIVLVSLEFHVTYCEVLPCARPAVKVRCLVGCTPCAILQRADVSDFQVVCSFAVPAATDNEVKEE
jgi:hypothetical protein